MIYATVEQFEVFYPNTGVTSSSIFANLELGATRTNEALGKKFTTPFSSNNASARELSIYYAYQGLRKRTAGGDDSAIFDLIEDRVETILGNCYMMTDSGESIESAGTDLPWSATMDYKPVFDQRQDYQQRVDPDLIDALNREDDNI